MQKVRLADDAVYINGLEVKWNEIKGVRAISGSFISQMGTRLPTAELFLEGGKVVAIPNKFVLEGQKQHQIEDRHKNRYPEFFILIEAISKNSPDLKSEVSSWLEWRLLLPVVIVELILGVILLFVYRINLEHGVTIALLGGVVFVPVGWVWERKARKKYWR